MVKSRSSRHAVKDWDNSAREDMKRPNPARIPIVNVADTIVPVAPRLGVPGSTLSDCLIAEADLTSPGPRSEMEFRNHSRLDGVAPQLFNMEPRSRPEKSLNIDLSLYQMEDY